VRTKLLWTIEILAALAVAVACCKAADAPPIQLMSRFTVPTGDGKVAWAILINDSGQPTLLIGSDMSSWVLTPKSQPQPAPVPPVPPTPPTPPKPPVPPSPPVPVPPTTIPAGRLWLFGVVQDLRKQAPEQASIQDSAALRDLLTANKNILRWLDPVVATTEQKVYVDRAVKDGLPRLLVVDAVPGAAVIRESLPMTTPSAAFAVVKKWTGPACPTGTCPLQGATK